MSTGIIGVIIGVVIGSITTSIGNFIVTLFQQKKQKQSTIDIRWWELKVETYSRIINALVQLVDYYDLIFSDATGDSPLSKERRAELNNNITSYDSTARTCTLTTQI